MVKGNNFLQRVRVDKRKIRGGKPRSLKPRIIAQKRGEAYRNAKGVLVRLTRVVRRVRDIRRRENKRTSELTGLPLPEKEEKVIFKPFATVVTGALDATARRMMEFASDVAKQRTINKKPGTGMRLKISDLEMAAKWLPKLAEK